MTFFQSECRIVLIQHEEENLVLRADIDDPAKENGTTAERLNRQKV